MPRLRPTGLSAELSTWLSSAGLLLALLFACVTPAEAHPSPFSYIDLDIRADAVHGTLVVHSMDAGHELDIDPSRLFDPVVLASYEKQLENLLGPRMHLRAGGVETIHWLKLEPVREQQAIRFTFTVDVARPGSITLKPQMFPYDPLHQSFANVYEDGVLKQQFVLSASAGEKTYYAGTRQGVIEVLKTFIPSGIEHILIGPDHILFLVGLLLLGGSWKALVRIVTAFTIGHSITLSLAALEIVMPPARLVEPAIALSIVFVGADNLVRGTGRDVRAWIALVFGLVHGFGFASVLREFGLPREALGWSLFSFNVGVEIGQLSIVLVVASLLAAVRRRSEPLGMQVARAGSLVVIVAGSYWFIQRVFFPA